MDGSDTGFAQDMDILERGLKAIEGFRPVPYGEVDRLLRDATRRTGGRIKESLKARVAELEENYA